MKMELLKYTHGAQLGCLDATKESLEDASGFFKRLCVVFFGIVWLCCMVAAAPSGVGWF